MSAMPAMSGTMPHLISRIDEARVRRDIADVGAERDLETAAERDPMDRGDDRNGKRAPDISRLLEVVGDPMRTLREIAEGGRALPAAIDANVSLSRPAQKPLPAPAQHDGAQARPCG